MNGIEEEEREENFIFILDSNPSSVSQHLLEFLSLCTKSTFQVSASPLLLCLLFLIMLPNLESQVLAFALQSSLSADPGLDVGNRL